VEITAICRDMTDYFHYVTEIYNGSRAVRVSTFGRFTYKNKVTTLNLFIKCYYETNAYCGDDWDFLESHNSDIDPLPDRYITKYFGLQTDSLAIAQHENIVQWCTRRLQEDLRNDVSKSRNKESVVSKNATANIPKKRTKD